MKLSTVIPYLKKIQKICNTRDMALSLLASAFFYQKSATFVISRNTNVDCFVTNYNGDNDTEYFLEVDIQ